MEWNCVEKSGNGGEWRRRGSELTRRELKRNRIEKTRGGQDTKRSDEKWNRTDKT